MLVSSHLLSEMELLADDVVIIAAGQLITQGPVDQILGVDGRRRAGAGPHAARRRSSPPRCRAAPWSRRTADGALLVTGVDAPAVGGPPCAPARAARAGRPNGPTSNRCSWS